MSVLTTMALMVTAIAKNLRGDRQDDRVAELEAQIAKIADDRDMWRERASEALRRAHDAPHHPQPAGPDFRPPQLAQAQLAQWQQAQGLAMAQYAQQQAQQYQQNLAAMQQQNSLNQGLLGAQGLQMPAEWCNCVPARHDMFLSGNGA
jgi:hypothetical protein